MERPDVADSELAAVLAIDGGNSKTDLALVAPDGTLLASLRGPGANHEDHGIEGAMRILNGLVGEVSARAGQPIDLGGGDSGAAGGLVAEHVSACLAGADLPAEEASLTAALLRQGWSRSAVAMNDTFAVLRAGLSGIAGGSGTDGPPCGVAVTCGAGINCVAVAPDGRVARYLALGTLTGDWGGGYGLSQAVMWHAMRGWDGRGPGTALGRAVAGHFGFDSIDDVAVAVHTGGLVEADLLGLTSVLFTVAADGDPVAVQLVERQAAEVCVMAGAAMRRLGLPPQGTPLVLGGGLLEARDPLLSGAIERCLAVEAPGAVPHVVDIPPIAGAALLGLDHLAASRDALGALRGSYRISATNGRGNSTKEIG
jgi:N-acetylglucosamine kinase-like BadF-type ATPase